MLLIKARKSRVEEEEDVEVGRMINKKNKISLA